MKILEIKVSFIQLFGNPEMENAKILKITILKRTGQQKHNQSADTEIRIMDEAADNNRT